ncbi:hypothetical protein DSO57_1001418, partial [Entomophthora muscae]
MASTCCPQNHLYLAWWPQLAFQTLIFTISTPWTSLPATPSLPQGPASNPHDRTPSPLPEAHLVQVSSKLGPFYITMPGLANQAVPHTSGWGLWCQRLVRITPIICIVFQARPATPLGG